jgi:hypothetical protein
VDLIGLLGPIVCKALLSSSFVQLVDSNLGTNAHDYSTDKHVGSNELRHGVSSVDATGLWQ